jgi:hypothetical protein
MYIRFMYRLRGLEFYNFHTCNMIFEKLLTIQPKWIHFDYVFNNISQCMYDMTC